MTARERRSALVIFALLLPSLLALWWSAQLASTLPRPGALRAFASGGQPFIGFFFNDALHLLDAQGAPVGRQPLAELALTEEPTDFDVTVDAAGRMQAWLFEDTKPRVVRCEVQPQPMRLAGCVQAMAGPQLKLQAARGAVHIAVDLTPVPEAGFDSEVTLWGRASNGTVLPIDEVAASAGTLSYELMCALAQRVPVVMD